MSKPNPPDRHHYIPVFYSKRWSRTDGQVLVFSRPHRAVIDRWKFPDATGYQDSLYKMHEHDPALAQQMEECFFKPIDGAAADALRQMETKGNGVRWTSNSRSAWTRFLLSLLFRCPEDIDFFRRQYRDDFGSSNEAMEAKYAEIRTADAPATFADYLKQRPVPIVEQGMFSTYQVLIENQNVGRFINQMEWRILDTSACGFRLLTSDRPIIRTNGMRREDGHLALPIGPHKLFIASYSTEYLRRLGETPMREIVRQCNKHVVEGACRFVYANDLSQASYIRANFGAHPQPRLLESMQKQYGEKARHLFR